MKAYELDESGVLAMLSLVSLCRKRFEDTYVSLFDILTLSDPIVFYRKILECMNSPTVVGCRNMIVNAIAYAIEMMSEQKTIGNKTAIESVVEKSLNDVVKKLGDLHFEVYLNSGKPYTMPSVFSKTIKEFGSLAECLATIEKSRDGVYVCYISIKGTIDGWFGFFFKSNGNIFSYNDRIDEEYVGQHGNMRNGRYVESKVDGIFPYELCEFSDERDYKGYSKSMLLGEGKDILLSSGEFGVFCRTILSIYIISNKHEGKVVDGEVVFVDSLLQNNIKQIENTKESNKALIKVDASAIAIANAEYKKPQYNLQKFLNGGYNKEHNCDGNVFRGVNQIFVDNYSDGFKLDFDKVLKSTSTLRLLGDTNCPQEFIGSKSRFDHRAYYEARLQLAKYIQNRINDEFNYFGGKEALRDWYVDKLNKQKDKILTLCAKSFMYMGNDKVSDDNYKPYYYGDEETSESFGGGTTRNCVFMNSYKYGYVNITNYEGRTPRCPFSGRTANVFFRFVFFSWNKVQDFIECDLPKFCQGWFASRPYNGNSILQMTDPVGNIVVPFYNTCCDFSFTIGVSKRTILNECKRIKEIEK